MQYRKCETVLNSFSGSSSEYDKSEDELFYEKYDRQAKFYAHEASGSRLFRRWFLNMIDLPNTLTNRFKDWLKTPPSSRSSTSDKSSGTNSVHPSEIILTGSTENNNDYNERYSRRKNCNNARKNYRAPGVHRPLKNHHVYHIYKQNEMEILRGVGGQRNYSTSWLQRNERFSSSPVLVLPRIDPGTGHPIFHPRNYHSITSTERRSVTNRGEDLNSDDWRSGIWELQANRYTHLRGDTNLIGDFIEKKIIEKSQSSLIPKRSSKYDDNCIENRELDLKNVELNVTGSTVFRETISMRLNLEDPQSFERTPDNKFLDVNNQNAIKAKETTEANSTEIHNPEKLSTVTQTNVDDLLRNLREKISSLNAERKIASPVGRLSSLIDSETKSFRGEHSLSPRWQARSSLFAKNIRPTYAETRTSFTERIQDIWIQEKASSQWAVLNKQRTVVPSETKRFEDNEESRDEKEIHCNVDDTNMRIYRIEDLPEEKEITSTEIETKARETNKSSIPYFSSSNNNETCKPTVCHVAVQYIVSEANSSKDLHHPAVLQSENNDDKSEIQIPQLLKPFTESNEILVDSIERPSAQESQACSQYLNEETVASSQPFVSVQYEAEMNHNPFEESSAKNNYSTLKNSFDDIKDKNTRLLSESLRERKFRYRFTRLTKTGLKRSIRFSRRPFLRAKKLHLPRYQFPKKVRIWIVQKFQSGSLLDGRKSFALMKSKLNCMGSIFKCIEKTSEINVSQGIFKDSPRIVRPAPPMRQKNRRAQSSVMKTTSAMSRDDEISSNEKSSMKCMPKVADNFSAIEPKTSRNCNTHTERSMTTLSVTTSNSTNIPLQLLGSTRDTTIIPSRDSQEDFKRQVVESPGYADIITRKQEIETCEETDDCRTDSLSPGPNLRSDETSNIFKFNDVLKIDDVCDGKMKHNKAKKIVSLDRKICKVDPTRKRLRAKENSPDNRIRRKEVKSKKAIVEKSHSLDIDNLPSRKRLLDKNEKIILSNKIAGARNANNRRLERRESVMDIGADKATMRSESKRKSAEMRVTSNGRLGDRESITNMPKLESSSKAERQEYKNLEKQQARGLNSMGFYPELMPAIPTKKLRRRADSPMIPRTAIVSEKRRGTAAGKSSLIPVGIGNLKYLSTVSKSTEKETKRIYKSKLTEEKNRKSVHSSQKQRASLKKTSQNSSSSSGNKIVNHRVHFELEKTSLKDEELKETDGDKAKYISENFMNQSSQPVSKIDDKRLVKKVKASLENGMPLKRITITDPHSVSKKSSIKYERRVKSKVEKDLIDQAEESRANTQNLTTRMEKTRSISRGDNFVDEKYPRRTTLLSEQIPKLGGTFEKRHPNESKLSYRSRSREKNKNESSDFAPERGSKIVNASIVDFARIKERVENEILERTSRTSGTEDSDCAIVLIKAINSSMELSDV